MGFNIDYREHNEDTLEAFLSAIQKDASKTEEEMLKEAGEQVKGHVVTELNKCRRVLAVRYKGRPAMADDVKVRRRTDKFGDKSVRVSGGKMTGTLWHLVNDGMLHSFGNHFMDIALSKLDGDIEKMWDKTMR